MPTTRRYFIRGLFAAPAIVAASSLMPVRGLIMPVSVVPSAWTDLALAEASLVWAAIDRVKPLSLSFFGED